MPSIIPGFQYDIFISYRQNDNRSGWVSQFVKQLEEEISATIKDPISIYFDENPHDGLHEHHEVDDSLREKLKCLIFIPIVSQTYCDPHCFAWEHEFKVFVEQASSDQFGLKTKVSGGNVASRVLPVKIHDLDSEDQQLFESEVGGVMRSIDFIYKETGVNRPLRPVDDRNQNLEKSDYRNQVNKVANAIKDILNSILSNDVVTEETDLQKASKPIADEEVILPKPKKKIVVKTPSMPKIRLNVGSKASRIALTVIIIILAGLAGFWFGTSFLPKKEVQVIKFPVQIQSNLDRIGRRSIALSPDGQYLCYTLGDQLYLRSLNKSGTGVPLAGTGGARQPFFSPDNKWLGFEHTGGLSKLPLIGGGSAQKICTYEEGAQGINWYEEGIFFGLENTIRKVSASGGNPEQIYIHESDDDIEIWNPQLLPGKKVLLFNLENVDKSTYEARFLKLNSKDSAGFLLEGVRDVRIVDSNHIAFVNDQQLYVKDFDLKSMSVTGESQLVMSDLVTHFNRAVAQYAFSENGTLAYHKSNALEETGNRQVVWIDQSGKLESIIRGSPRFYYTPSLSPDGKQIAIDYRTPNGTIAMDLVNVELGTTTGFIKDNSIRTPTWHPDGKTITYASSYESSRAGKDIYEKPVDLSYAPRLLFTLEEKFAWLGNWSQDGRYLMLSYWIENFSRNIGYFDREDSVFKSMDFINTTEREMLPQISPDGKWLAYTSNKDGNDQVFVVPFPGPGREHKVSANQGFSPIWAPDMSALFFIGGGGGGSDLWKANIKIDQEFSTEEPIPLFKGSFYRAYNSVRYGRFDIHPDGDRFLMVGLCCNAG